jgi:predicted MPP superfamily phosphohydrolase
VRADEKLRVFLFIALVALVYVGAFGVLLRRWIGLRAQARAPWLDRVKLALAALGLPCLAYGFIEPYRLEITTVRLASERLAGARRPIRIVHLSDLHCDSQPRLEETLPGVVAALHPDLIVFIGDAVNSPEGLPLFRKTMAALAAMAPTYAVRGNWDVWYWSHLDLFGGTGVHELDGVENVAVAGTTLSLVGFPVQWERGHGLPRLLPTLPAGTFRLLLHHYPDEIDAARNRVDLYCAGHTHGGQVALPFYGALVTFSRYGKQYEAGLYRAGRTWLYVNRGIGMEGGALTPRVRFCARPEVTLIELVPAAAG